MVQKIYHLGQTLLVFIRVKTYPFWHSLFCDGNLEILVPKPEIIAEGDIESYFQCEKCGKKYHLINVSQEEE